MNNERQLIRMVVGYVLKDGKLLLGLRKQVSLGLGQNIVSGIGGKVGDTEETNDETPDQALVREFKEEIGAVPANYVNVGRLIFLFPNKPKWDQTAEVYRISELVGEPHETDAIRPLWYPVAGIPFEHMWDDAKYYLPDVLAGKHVDATFTYGQDNRTVAAYDVHFI